MQSSLSAMSRDVYQSGSEDHGRQLLTEHLPKQSSVIDTSRFLFYLLIPNVVWFSQDELIA